MKKICPICFFILITFGMEVTLYAQSEDEETIALSDMVVEASKNIRASEKNDTPKSTIAVEEFTAEEIQAMHPRDIFDVIEFASGTRLERGKPDQRDRIYSRGGSLAIILDGVYIQKTMTIMSFASLPVDMIESVKVVRDSTVLPLVPMAGMGSSKGGAASQGAVIITTKKKPTSNFDATLGYASYDTRKVSLFAGKEFTEHFSCGIGFAKERSDGKDDWNNSYDSNTVLINAKYDKEKLKVDTSLLMNTGVKYIQNTSTDETKLSRRNDEIDGLIFTFNTNYFWTENNKTTFTYGHSHAEIIKNKNYYNAVTDTTTGTTYDPRVYWADDINLYHTNSAGPNLLQIGSQIIRNYSHVPENGTDPAQDEVYGFYFSDEIFVTDKLSFDCGARFDKRHVTKGSSKYSTDGSTITTESGTWTDDTYGFSIGASYSFGPILTIAPRFGYNYTPTPSTMTTENDEELPAEERFKYELGLRSQFSKYLTVEVTPYLYDITNGKTSSSTITIDDDDIKVYALQKNVQRYGAEVSFSGKIDTGKIGKIGYRASYTYYRTSDDDENTSTPDNAYSGQLNYEINGFKFSGSVRIVDPYYGTSKDITYTIGDYTLCNASISKSFFIGGNTYKVDLWGRNLLDEHYLLRPGNWQDIGRVIGMDVSFSF